MKAFKIKITPPIIIQENDLKHKWKNYFVTSFFLNKSIFKIINKNIIEVIFIK